MKLDWNKIVTNAVSTVVTMIVVGACLMLWRAAMSVEEKVNDANKSLEVVVEEVQKELIDSKQQINELVSTINELREEITRFHKESNPNHNPEDIVIAPLIPKIVPKDNFLEQRVQETAPRMWEQRSR